MTGAAILVAVIVLLVPELLSRPRHAAPQAVAAVDEAPIRSYTLSLGDAQPSAATTTANGARPDWPPADGAPHAPVSTAAVSAPAGSQGESAPAAAIASRGAAPARKSPARSVSTAADAVSAAHEASEARGWAVQVGSFGSRENADRLVHRLKLKGYGVFITESSSRGRKWYRVRVGPERDRSAADATVARLRAAGLRGAVAQPR